ncbi:hypothetical protein SEPCBS119000_002425 [Sporothrix epigloea]|uniref:Uncharacterized protein n=1 Tax=Sporothrix epigloea TaxID=1892477 RepID=A0ABP0DIV0_9PEZI
MAAAAENAAAGTLNPSVTSLLGPHPQLTTQPPPVMPTRSKFRQLPCATLPANYQHKLLPPNRQLKLKRYSDPAMAPIIEHPDDTSRVWGYNSSRASSLYSERGRLATNFPDNNSEDMLSSFIPSRPAPVPVRPSGVSPPQSPSMLSAASFPSGASSSMAKIIKYTPTIRLSQSYFDNRASSTSPRSPAFAPVALQSTPAVTPARKKSLPTSVDISNPWPVSPPPRPPPPPPLHSSVIAEVEDGENITEVAEFKLRSRSGRSATLFQNELCDDTSDPLRAPAAALSSAFTIDLSLHSWRRSDGSASESIATSTTTANDDTSITASSASRSSGLSVPSSSAAGSTFDKARTAAIGTFSSASTTCSRHSLHSPLKPPLPPPNCPLPPLPASGRICGPVSASRPMPGSMSLAEYSTIKPHLSTQSTFNEVDEDASAASVAAGKIQQIAPRGDIRLRPTALGRSLSQRENSSHMYVSTTPDMKLAGISVSRSSVPAAASSLQGNNLEVDKWCNDLRSRIHLFSEVEKTVAERPMARIAAQQVKKTAGSVPPPTLKERFPVYGAWPGSVCGLVDGGMI